MNFLRTLAVVVLITTGCSASDTNTGSNKTGSDKDRDALQKTSVAIRAAFARGDVAGILEYHHPDVVKALAYNKFLNGREALRADLTETLSHVKLEWQENNVESLLIHGDIAVEMTAFTIKRHSQGRRTTLHLQRARDGGLCSLCEEPHRMGIHSRGRAAGKLGQGSCEGRGF